MCKAAHAFRGEFIDQCARVEHWLADVLRREGGATKAYLFGAKIKAVADLAKAHPNRFSKADRVSELLTQFAPYAKLRSELAHAVVAAPKTADADLLFRGIGATGAAETWRFWITQAEARTMLGELTHLAKHITDQQLTA